jgi:N-acetylglucosamine kinase-like BadF-type ATPase
LDCGGTKCEAMALDENGVVLGWGYCEGGAPGSQNEHLGGFGRSKEAILEAATQALNGISYDELEIVGSTDAQVELRGRIILIRFIPEELAALALVGQENGLVVIAGTGARVFGRTSLGCEFGLDGLGPTLGDYGGGYQIGLMALRAAARSRWHPRHYSSLGQLVRQKLLGDRSRDDDGDCLIPFSLVDANRASVAQLAELVDAEAVKGDEVALQILAETSALLADTIYDVYARLQMNMNECYMVGTGSVVTRSQLYWQLLCSKVSAFAPLVQPKISDLRPVVGYAVAALKTRSPSGCLEPAATLLRSAREHPKLAT